VHHSAAVGSEPETDGAGNSATPKYAASLPAVSRVIPRSPLTKRWRIGAATPVTPSVLLKMAAKTERFVDNDAANALLTRNYREPFVVPEIA